MQFPVLDLGLVHSGSEPFNYLSTSGVAYVTHSAEVKEDLEACFHKRLSCFMNAICTEKQALASVYILTCNTVWPRNDAKCMLESQLSLIFYNEGG